ncbi:peptidyl-tRNA hydrolase [Pseudonocardiaceae bacterium YIM PH 21723]|nr:peptidyl-tRNA hydrolase [Pseudonocardiaceae bacterium YIM PH 21723]
MSPGQQDRLDGYSWLVNDDPAQVRAMPVVLRIEKAEPPLRTPLLEAAAAAAVAVYLDERAAPGGEWHEPMKLWVDGRIRKVSRRARGAHWTAVQELPGLTIEVEGAQARALVPGPVDELPKIVSRLQVGGTDLPVDEPDAAQAGVPVLWVNPTVPMTLGKIAAQVGHGTMLLADALREYGRADLLDLWKNMDHRTAVRTPNRADWVTLLRSPDAISVRDGGFTEVAPGTITVLATWP